MATATKESNPQARRFESERIHASPMVLILGAIGLAIYGVGRLLGSAIFGSAHGQLGSAIAFVGTAVLVVAVVLHVDHLSFRLGRSAVVLVIIGAIAVGIGNLLGALNASSKGPLWFVGAGFALAGVGVAMVAVHKEGQMKATLADYVAGAPWQARVTVYASFFSLITAALGFVLYGIGIMGMANVTGRGPLVLMCVGSVLAAIGVISHVEHLVPRIGLVAVIAGILAPLVYAANPFLGAFDPANAANATYWHVCLGIGTLLGALACVLAFSKKLSTDR